jgi:hypothetical protein
VIGTVSALSAAFLPELQNTLQLSKLLSRTVVTVSGYQNTAGMRKTHTMMDGRQQWQLKFSSNTQAAPESVAGSTETG